MPSGIYLHKKGYKRPLFSKEWRENISKAVKGKPTWMTGSSGEHTSMWGKKHSEETKQKMRIAAIKNGAKPPRPKQKKTPEWVKEKLSKSHIGKVGKLASNWQGGKTPEQKRIRRSIEYRLWRQSVFRRDNYTCVWCGIKENIQADHIKPFALYPELRFAIDNGRTLCINCHRTVHKRIKTFLSNMIQLRGGVNKDI